MGKYKFKVYVVKSQAEVEVDAKNEAAAKEEAMNMVGRREVEFGNFTDSPSSCLIIPVEDEKPKQEKPKPKKQEKSNPKKNDKKDKKGNGNVIEEDPLEEPVPVEESEDEEEDDEEIVD